MSVNSNIYGLPSSWKTASAGSTKYTTFKIPLFTEITGVADAYQCITSTFNAAATPIKDAPAKMPAGKKYPDNSICYVGTDNGADCLQTKWVRFNYNEKSREYAEYTTEIDSNNPIYLSCNLQAPASLQYDSLSIPPIVTNGTYSNLPWGFDIDERNYRLDVSSTQGKVVIPWNTVHVNTTIPVLDFQMKQNVWCIFVNVYGFPKGKTINDIKTYSDTYSFLNHSFDLKGYLEGYVTVDGVKMKAYEAYPYIQSVTICCYSDDEAPSPEGVHSRSAYNGYGGSPSVAALGFDKIGKAGEFTYDYLNSDNEIVQRKFFTFTKGFTGEISPQCYDKDNTNTYLTSKLTSYSHSSLGGYVINTSAYTPISSSSYELYPIINPNKFKMHKLSNNLDNYNNGYFRCGLVVAGLMTGDEYQSWSSVESFKEYWLSQTARLGMLFTDNRETAKFAPIDSVGMYMGVIDGNGITHGEYVEGTEILKQPQLLWTHPIDNSPYTPPKQDGSDTEGLQKDFGDLTSKLHAGGYVSGTDYYVCTAAELTSLTKSLNSGYKTKLSELPEGSSVTDYIQADFKGMNPFEYVTGVTFFPFEVSSVMGTKEIVVGSYATGVSGLELTATYGQQGINLLDFGTISIEPYFNDFRDYTPYTTMTLHLPFCSTIELDPAMFIQPGNSINLGVKIAIDFRTGDCICLVFRNELLITTSNGSCGATMPLTLVAMADYQNQIAQLSIQKEQATASFISSFLSGAVNTVGGFMGTGSTATGMPSVATGAMAGINTLSNAYIQGKEIKKIDYSLTHTAPHVGSIGSASPINSMVLEYQPILVISRAQNLPSTSLSRYGETIGYACNKQGLISDFSGYTVCANTIINVDCTEEEKNIINNLLVSGVII